MTALKLDTKVAIPTGAVGWVAVLGDESVTIEVDGPEGLAEFEVPYQTAIHWANNYDDDDAENQHKTAAASDTTETDDGDWIYADADATVDVRDWR